MTRPTTLSLPDFPAVEVLPPTPATEAAWKAALERVLTADLAPERAGEQAEPRAAAPGEGRRVA